MPANSKMQAVTRLVSTSLVLLVAAGCASVPGPAQRTGSEDRSAATSARPARSGNSLLSADSGTFNAIEIDPIERILAERRRGDYPELEADELGFTITEQLNISGAARSRYEQALLMLNQQRIAEGIASLEALTRDEPEISAPHIDLGIAYARNGDLENAIEALETAALLSPGHPVIHNELGILYRRNGRFTEARAQYEQALNVFAEFHFARRNLAVLCDLYLADLQCAFDNYTAYLQNVDGDPEAEIWVADIRARLAASGVGE